MTHCLVEGPYTIVPTALVSVDGENASKVDPSIVASLSPLLKASSSICIPTAPADASFLNLQYLLTQRLRL